ncbi:RagB/SusD family nutrient uptake outer membrane protein [Ferruginibacter albus]|uniref:RagB/SusD family nutrient uptake outer membrane protein n=1 Tax=Ferruginibacter albus TaxID=2875540 RepID=UPI001CC4817B|nr:RagB/SusD family nutrient uptake outer membrane protein [Ferruginibacter albus]UAY51215.1 RagB/SusD family nutrient uptake outer membrane protein [Ferruginibacter albus]
MYKKIIVIAIAVVGLASCFKEPGDLYPTNEPVYNNYPKTIADLTTFVTPGYSNFRNANLYGYQYLPLVLSCDHSFCSQNSAGNPFTIQGGDFLTNNINVTNTPNAALYAQLYTGVSAMNVYFDRARYFQITYGDKNAADVRALSGQAYFLRAYYYFLLEGFYGEKYIDMTQPEDPNVLGVPMPLTFATNIQETNLPRSSAYQVWSQIITDLDSAVANLQGVTYDATNQGRITEWAAKAMLGKAYVFTKQYDKARPVLLDVINNSGKQLMNYSQYKDAFNGNTANEFNSESLFEINVDRQADQGGILFSSNYKQSLTTDAGELWAPAIIGALGVDSLGNGDGNGGTSANMGNNYCKFFVHDRSLRRFGFDLPVYTYEANPNAVGQNSASSPSYMMDHVSYQNSLAARTNNTVDPRLFVCALEPWVDSCQQQYSVDHRPSNSTIAQYPVTIPVGKAFIINSDRTAFWGWNSRKYATTENSILAYGGNDASNIYMLRLADVYLLYAEASMTSSPSDALHYINEVHSRAYGGSHAFDYASLTAATKATGANDELANDPLKYERYVELFGEGGWWFDVCRWGIGSQEATYYLYGSTEYNPKTNSGPDFSKINAGNWSGSGTQIKAQHFPIPAQEISINTAIQRNNYPY